MAGMVRENLGDIAECCICTDLLNDPRMLPCIHTFCLECLLKFAAQNETRLSGRRMPCPLCRQQFDIPPDGLKGLKKNFFAERLVELVKAAKVEDSSTLCDICAENKDDENSPTPAATMFCLDCSENLCKFCAIHHKRQKLAKNHKVVDRGSLLRGELRPDVSRLNTSSRTCDDHEGEALKLYCFDCKKVICVFCCVESHKLHDCADVIKVADDFNAQISSDVSQFSSCVTDLLAKKEQLEKERQKFMNHLEDTERAIREQSKQLQDLINQHTKILLDELNSLKQARLKDIETDKEEIDEQLTIISNFKRYCGEVKSRGSPGDICRMMNDLRTRADELMKMMTGLQEKKGPNVKDFAFIRTEIEETSMNTRNIVGQIREIDEKEVEDLRKSDYVSQAKPNYEQTALSLQFMTSLKLINRAVVYGVTKLWNQIYIVYQCPNALLVYDDEVPFAVRKQMKLEEVTDPEDIVASEFSRCLYVVDGFSAFTNSGNKCVWKITAADHRKTKWLENMGEPYTMSVSSDGRVLVLRKGQPSTLDIHRPSGDLMSRLRLPAKLKNPIHAVETSRATFVVSHMTSDDDANEFGVWELERDGKILRRTVGVTRMRNWPRRLALDSDDRVFVVDSSNNVVILLDNELRRRQELLTRETAVIQWPSRIFLDREKRQLIVVHGRLQGGKMVDIYDVCTSGLIEGKLRKSERMASTRSLYQPSSSSTLEFV